MRVLRHKLVNDDGSEVPFVRSPNQSGEVGHEFLVMHYTAGRSAESSVNWLTNPDSRASAHVVIGRDGSVTQLVAFDRRAYHAGSSSWLGFDGLNSYSLGIELDNAGRLMRAGEHWRAWFGTRIDGDDVVEAVHRNETVAAGWHTFSEAQIERALEVAVALVRKYELKDIVGHEDISPMRKVDPGPAFPMLSFRSRVLGRAEDEGPDHETLTTLNIRTGPGTQFDRLEAGPLPPGTPLRVLAEQGSWRLVDVLEPIREIADLQGWVHGGFLRMVG